MPQLKYTKLELIELRKKQTRFQKYVPTLKTKKSLLQVEVNKANTEVETSLNRYEKEKKSLLPHAKLLTDKQTSDLQGSLEIREVKRRYEAIAGIEVPYLEDVVFEEPKNYLMFQPLWVDEFTQMLRVLSKAYQRIKVAREKKKILEEELRKVTIRVNLFEKRLIPQLERDISKIRIYLGDQELQAVSVAKVAKKNILGREIA